uniref:Protein AHNAK2 n=1 Tax=Pelodiscus sinensis TaxID=13735 RepID=K7EXI9_PELSI
MPKFSLPKMKSHKAQYSLPKLESDVSGSKPENESDIRVKISEKGSSGDGEGMVTKMPKVKLSSLELSQRETKAPRIDVDISFPATSAGSIELKSPEIGVEGSSEGIAVDGAVKNVEGLEGKITMPKFQKPKFGVSFPKGKVPESEINIPKMEADFPQVKIMTDIIAVEAPTMEVESAIANKETEFSGLKMKVPQIPEMDIKAPNIDINLKSCDSVPMAETGIQDSNMASKAGKVKGEIKSGDTDAEGKEGHFKLPKFKLPSFSWSPKKEASIKTDFEVPLEEPKITVSSSKIDTKLAETVTEGQDPSMDFDTEISTEKEEQKGQIKKPQFIMPKISFTKTKAPKSQVQLPKVGADVSVPKTEGDTQDLVQIPDIESSHTESIDEGAQISIKMPKVKIPTLEYSKPEIKVPKAEVGISLPKTDDIFPIYGASLQQADLKSGSAGVDVSLSSGIKFPTAEASTELTSPETGIEGPLAMDGADVKTDGPEEKIKMPKFQKSKFGISLPKGKRPESEISLPKMEAGVPQLTMTTDIADIAVEAPVLEVKSDVSDAGIEISDGKMKIPQVPITDIKTPEMDVNVPSVSGSVTGMAIQSPEMEDMKVQGEHEMKSGEIQTEEYQGWFKMPKFRMPTFGRSSSKEKRGDIDSEGTLEKPHVSAPSAEIQTEIEVPEYATSLTHVDTDPAAGKDVFKGKIKSDKANIPKVGVSLHKGESADVTLSKFEAKVSLPPEKAVLKVNIPETETYADVVKRGAEGQKLKTHTSKVTIPKVELSASEISASKTGVDISLPKADITLPECDLTLQEQKTKSEYAEVPTAECSIEVKSPERGDKTPSVEIPKVELNVLNLKRPHSDLMEPSTRISKPEKQSESLEINIRIPKLKVPAFTYDTPRTETDVSTSKIAKDLKGACTDIEAPKLEVSTRIPKERTESVGSNIQMPSVKGATMAQCDFKTQEVHVKLPSTDSSVSKAVLQIQGPLVEDKEIKTEGEVEAGCIDIERHETYSSLIIKESEIPSSEIKTAALGFSLLKAKIPESHMKLDMPVKLQSYTEYKQEMSENEVHPLKVSDGNLGVAIQNTDTTAFKLSGKSQSETDESNDVVSSSSVSLPKLKTFTVEMQPSSKLGDTQSAKQLEEIAVSPVYQEDEIVKIPEDEEKYMKDQNEKSDSKRSSSRFKFWLPSIGFSSSVDDTGSDSKPDVQKSVPEETQPPDSYVSYTDSSKQTEKTGWFRFPKLGFSSPSKKAKNVDTEEEETTLKETRTSDEESPSEKPETFFDAEESLSPKEETKKGEENEMTGTTSNVQVSGAIVTSSARTELILLERERSSQQSTSEKSTK